ncbi:glycosyltransferase family 39 protein [Candidatus Curtissbacteria bacterium]|nr:glycosyltransferase family 39 protein [Candidatus Curtissbacteria bacterium]
MEKAKTKLKEFILKNRAEVIFVSLIILAGLFLRLYRIEGFLTFLGDEGRDVRIVRDLLRGNLIFIGPQTSIGNMYLGPLYYYMMAPALFLSRLSPVGPAVMTAILGTLTVFLTWLIGRSWFGKTAGLIAALLFALSPVAIIYSRSSWNPNPMPFFALISIWAIWKVYAEKKFAYLSLSALSLGAALQMHYLGLLLVPTLGIFWLLTARSLKEKKLFVRHTLLAIGLFLLLMSPLALFDLKHDGMNFKAFKAFFSDRQTTVNLNPLRSDRFGLVLSKVTSDMVLSRQNNISLVVGLILILAFVFVLIKNKKHKIYWLLASWLFFGFLGLAVYKQHVYAHYYGFIYPAIYFLLGITLAYFLKTNLIAKIASAILLIYLVYLSLAFSPTKDQPNRQLARTQEVVRLIMKEAGDKTFNFGLIAKQNYDESYRYFLENYNAKMVRGEDKITDQLFVVCEDGDKCQPEGNPAYQVAIFGPSHVVDTWQIDYIKIYRLLHSQ